MPSAEIAAWYARAAGELAEHSPRHARWAAEIADDPALLTRIGELPRPQRQPSLLFSLAAWLGAPVGDDDLAPLRRWLIAEWPRVLAAAPGRTTQTNEVGRCAPLVAALDRLEHDSRIAGAPSGPIALIELGTSAGLCLLPDRYSMRFTAARDAAESRTLGEGAPRIACTVSGVGRLPERMPRIAWRAGVDLHPRSVHDDDDRRWLEALVPPDRPDRLARLRAALDTAAAATTPADPSPVALHLVAGDALEQLPALLAAVPAGLTPVVVSLGTLVYLPATARDEVLALVDRAGAHLVTLEGTAALPQVAARLGDRRAPEPTPFLLALDGDPLAHVTPHGDRISWLAERLPGGSLAST